MRQKNSYWKLSYSASKTDFLLFLSEFNFPLLLGVLIGKDFKYWIEVQGNLEGSIIF